MKNVLVCFGLRFVHRLDYATSGVLCVALSRASSAAMHKVFSKGEATKHYVALVSFSSLVRL